MYKCSLTPALCLSRPVAALCQCFSLGGVYNAFLLLVFPQRRGVIVDVGNPSPLIGKHAVAQLKTLEAVVESAPQTVLQLYIALWLGYTSTLARSLLISVASLAVSMAMGDRAAVAGHAAQRLDKHIAVPLLVSVVAQADGGVTTAETGGDISTTATTTTTTTATTSSSKSGGVGSRCYCRGRTRLCRFTLCGSRYKMMATLDFLVVALFRLVEVGARLGVAALLFLALGSAAWGGLAWVLAASAVWWFGGLLLLAGLPRDVREAAFSLRPGPRHVTVWGTLVALVYSSISFPGIILAAKRSDKDPARQQQQQQQQQEEQSRKTMLTMDTWMSGLWTSGWTLSPAAYCGLRTLEHASALLAM